LSNKWKRGELTAGGGVTGGSDVGTLYIGIGCSKSNSNRNRRHQHCWRKRSRLRSIIDPFIGVELQEQTNRNHLSRHHAGSPYRYSPHKHVYIYIFPILVGAKQSAPIVRPQSSGSSILQSCVRCSSALLRQGDVE